MKRADKARRIRRILDELYPEVKIPLDHRDPYTLLVAVLLSAQCTDVKVNQITPILFARAATPQAMMKLSVAEIRSIIRPCGLSPAKARAIAGLSKILVERHGGRVPDDFEALEALPGVGRKTANVILNVAFGEPTLAVDTHVFRVANRTGLSDGKTPAAVEEDLLRVIPPKYALHAHHWLILHGRYVCKARRPECPTCLIRDLCLYEAKTPGIGA